MISKYFSVLSLVATFLAPSLFAADLVLPICEKEAKELCGAPKAERGWMMRCLRTHKNKLSTACVDELKTTAPCPADVRSLCSAVHPTEISQCLTKNYEKLSGECRTEIEKSDPCRKDRETHCKGMARLEAVGCLGAVYPKLSPECRKKYPEKVVCAPDSARFCSAAKTRKERAECFIENLTSFTPACVKFIKSQSCYPRVESFCKNAKLEWSACMKKPDARRLMTQCLIDIKGDTSRWSNIK